MEKIRGVIPAKGISELPFTVTIRKPDFSSREFAPHKHKEFELALFIDGSGVYKTLDSQYDIAAGDIFLFSTDEIHCITDITSPMSVITIKFEPRFIWAGENPFFDVKYLQIFFGKDIKSGNRLNRNNPHIGEIRMLMREMEHEFTDKPEEYEMMMKIQLVMLLVKIKRYFYESSVGDTAVLRSTLRPIEAAMDYIDSRFTEKLTLSDIAANANMSPNYFCSVFKKLNGLSAWDYITLKRIDHARELLRTGSDQNMLSLAQQCGFSGTAGFNKAFRRTTGFTPTEYVKRHIPRE